MTAVGPTEERREVLEVLRRILQSVGSVRDEREIFEIVVREGARRFGYDWLSVVLAGPEPDTARVLLSVPAGAGVLRAGELVKAPSGFHEATRSGRPFVRQSLTTGGPLWEDAGLRDIGLAAYAVVPMRAGSQVVGALGFGTRRMMDVTPHLDLMTVLAEFVASAALAARQVEEVHRGLARLREKAAVPLPPDF